MIIPWKELTDSIFDALWSAEDPFPILVTGAMEGLQLDWDPSFFSETFRDYLCQVQNCVTGEIFTTTVDKIFSNYGQDADIVGRMKVCNIFPVIPMPSSLFIRRTGLQVKTSRLLSPSVSFAMTFSEHCPCAMYYDQMDAAMPYLISLMVAQSLI